MVYEIVALLEFDFFLLLFSEIIFLKFFFLSHIANEKKSRFIFVSFEEINSFDNVSKKSRHSFDNMFVKDFVLFFFLKIIWFFDNFFFIHCYILLFQIFQFCHVHENTFLPSAITIRNTTYLSNIFCQYAVTRITSGQS